MGYKQNHQHSLLGQIGQKAVEIGNAISKGFVIGKKIYDVGRTAYEFAQAAAPVVAEAIETAAPLAAGLL